MITVLFYGDLVGNPGRDACKRHLREERATLLPDIVIANGENSSGGLGIEPENAEEMFEAGVDIITSGNHIWQKNNIEPYLEKNRHRLLRPENFPPGTPGVGSLVWTTASGVKIFIINLIGRVFMPQHVDCPFQCFDRLMESEEAKSASLTIVDFHCETTSEKRAFGYFVDGRASAALGTHTHVQTADETILPKGTAYITDVGMCGATQSILGFQTEKIIKRFLTARPYRLEVAKGSETVNGCLLKLDETTKQAVSIERILKHY